MIFGCIAGRPGGGELRSKRANLILGKELEVDREGQNQRV